MTCHCTHTYNPTVGNATKPIPVIFQTNCVLSRCRADCRYGDSLSVGASAKRSLIAFISFFVLSARCTLVRVCSVGVAVYPSRLVLLLLRCFAATVSPDLVCLLAFQDALGVFPSSPKHCVVAIKRPLESHVRALIAHNMLSLRHGPLSLDFLYNHHSPAYGN